MNDELKNAKRLQFSNGVLQAALVLCVLTGIACRFTGLNWDSGFHLHPDERFLTMTANALQWPHSWSAYFATDRAPLNPFNHDIAFFVYGQLPLVLVKAVVTVLHRDNYDALVLAGRFLSAFFDTLSLVFIFLIGREIGGSRWLGLLAAALFSLTALDIQQSHFFVVDTFAATFLVAAFYFAVCSSTLGVRRWTLDVLSGLCWGAAIACKFSSVLFGFAIIAFLFVGWKKGKARLAPTMLVLLAAFVAFRVLHPIAFRGEGGVLTLWGLLDVRPHPQFWKALAEQAAISRGAVEAPFNLQWFHRTAYLWPLWNLGRWALGWPLLLCAVAGAALVGTRVLRRRPVPSAIIIAALWIVFLFGFYGAQFSKFTRYYLPITPFCALLAAWLLVELWRTMRTHKAKIAIGIGSAGVLGSSLLWSLAVASIYTRVHPRVAVTSWILQHIPAGAAVANETAWDDALPLRDLAQYRALDLRLFDADGEAKRRHLLQVLNEAQWIFISSPRVWKTVPRLPQRFPLTSAYYRALFDGSLGFALVREFSSYPQLFGRHFPDDDVEEALTVYDHPRVLLLHKTNKYSADNAARILSEKRLAP
jgi:hypothetical protein